MVAFLVIQKKADPELLNYHEVIFGQSYQRLRFDIDAPIEFIENVMSHIKRREEIFMQTWVLCSLNLAGQSLGKWEINQWKDKASPLVAALSPQCHTCLVGWLMSKHPNIQGSHRRSPEKDFRHLSQFAHHLAKTAIILFDAAFHLKIQTTDPTSHKISHKVSQDLFHKRLWNSLWQTSLLDPPFVLKKNLQKQSVWVGRCLSQTHVSCLIPGAFFIPAPPLKGAHSFHSFMYWFDSSSKASPSKGGCVDGAPEFFCPLERFVLAHVSKLWEWMNEWMEQEAKRIRETISKRKSSKTLISGRPFFMKHISFWWNIWDSLLSTKSFDSQNAFRFDETFEFTKEMCGEVTLDLSFFIPTAV